MSRTLLIVDDHAGFRSWARTLLEAAGYVVVGEAEDGESALAAVTALRPELVLLDIRLPDLDGFQVLERLTAGEDPPAVVLISTRDEQDYGERIRKSGARGFIAKADLSTASLEALLAADINRPSRPPPIP